MKLTISRLLVVTVLSFFWVPSSVSSNMKNNSCVKLVKELNVQVARFPQDQLLGRKDTYLWDNWIVRDRVSGNYFRYSLSAPHSVGDNSARHVHARLRVFSSQNGIDWSDEGLILEDGLTWSGNAFQGIDGKFYLLHTRSKVLENDIHQKIALSTSTDGIHFTPSKTLIDPWEKETRSLLESKGYHVGTHNGLISAWRDPYMFEDTLYLATKKKKTSGEIVMAIGRLKFPERNFSKKPIILSPMEIPIGPEIRELEVPNMAKLPDGRYLLSVNLTDRASPSATTEEVNSWVRFYVSDSTEGPWRAASGPSLDAQGNLYTPADRVYGFNIMSGAGVGKVRGAGFFRSGGQEPHALTPLVDVKIDSE